MDGDGGANVWSPDEIAGLLFGGPQPEPADPTLAGRVQRGVERELSETASLARADLDRALLPIRLRHDDFHSLLSCEAYYIARAAEEFSYNLPKAKPEVSHRTIHRLSRKSPKDRGDPYDSVVQTIEGLIHSDESNPKLQGFLRDLPAVEHAELVEDVTRTVGQFLEGWPSLPETQTFRVREEYVRSFANRTVRVKVIVPFRIGKSHGSGTNRRSGSILLGLRSGSDYDWEERQTRFLWALLETLKFGIPPRRVASWYLDSNEMFVDDVDEGIIESAAARVVDAIKVAVDLKVSGREPMIRGCSRCTYCPALEGCSVGQREVARRHQ